MTQHDLLDRVKDAKMYQTNFLIWKEQWDAYHDLIPLNWKCVKFEASNRNQIPTKTGIYAFFVEPRIAGFPSHGYLMYIGETGQDSHHHLQKRFDDYLQDQKRTKRVHIHLMLNLWDSYLYFYYVEIDSNQINLKTLEQTLLDTFTPPFVKRGFSIRIGNVIKGLGR